MFLSAKSQTQKTTNYMILFVWHSRKGKIMGLKADQWLPMVGSRGHGWLKWDAERNFLYNGTVLYHAYGDRS